MEEERDVRVVSPPLSQLDKLTEPPSAAERAFLDFMLDSLPAGWEVYVKPHLNGLQPSLVVLHPEFGIGVFEVIDNDMAAAPQREIDRLLLRAKFLKEEITHIYCPRCASRTGVMVLTSGLVCPDSDDDALRNAFFESRRRRGMLASPELYPLIGRQTLDKADMRYVFSAANPMRSPSPVMSEPMAADLRNWLVEPDVSARQRRPLPLLNRQQRLLATQRTETGYRKIKGPAGSGKSLVIAARAAQLASEGKDVLVVSFNITMLNYLMDLASRWTAEPRRTRSITWLHFHRWCRRVCVYEADEADAYAALWRGGSSDGPGGQDADSHRESVLRLGLAALVERVIGDHPGSVTKYDAILVDEGQDFELEWWNCLRRILRPDGEMVLAADRSQDIYAVSRNWTERKMTGSGLAGAWTQLKWSYRLPSQVADLATEFAERFIPSELRDSPLSPPEQGEVLTGLRWVQVTQDGAAQVLAEEMLALAPSADPAILAMADITLMTADQSTGLDVEKVLLERYGVHLEHTFSEDEEESRKLKLCFFQGNPRLKATTIHSFKGWESRSLVLYTGSRWDERSKALIYTGLTRLKASDEGSYLTVVCAVDELVPFGRTWPYFMDKRHG